MMSSTGVRGSSTGPDGSWRVGLVSCPGYPVRSSRMLVWRPMMGYPKDSSMSPKVLAIS